MTGFDGGRGPRYVVAYSRTRGAVFVKDTWIGETVGTWWGTDALLFASEQAARLNAQGGTP